MGVGESAGVVVVVPAGGVGELAGGRGAGEDVDPDRDVVAGDAEALFDHLGGEQRAGIDGDDDRAGVADLAGEVTGPHREGELALGVGGAVIEAAAAGEGVEVDACLGGR